MTSFYIFSLFENEVVHSKGHQGCLLALYYHKTQCGIFQSSVASVTCLLSLLYAYHFSQFPVMHFVW